MSAMMLLMGFALIALVRSQGCAGTPNCTVTDTSCDTSLIGNGPQFIKSCEGIPRLNNSESCLVSCAPGWSSPVGGSVNRTCVQNGVWSMSDPRCLDPHRETCFWFPCGANATCRDLPPPAVNNSAGRSCECNYGFVGNPLTVCILNSTVPCAPGTWSASGYVPCTPCRICATGVTTACTAVSNTECNPSNHCGYISGDPHFLSLDGAYYDYQGYGEFVAMQSTDNNDISVQTRFHPCGSGVTCMVGAAFGVAGPTAVSIAYDNPTVFPRVLRVFQNNINVGASLPITVNGMVFETIANGYRVTIASRGVTVQLLDYGYLYGTFCASSSNWGKIDGLLGVFDGSPSNDNPNSQSGQSSQFKIQSAEGFRVTEMDSALHYGANESYATLNDPGYVGHDFTNFQPSNEAVAACTGLSGDALQGCLRDVTVTGETSFATNAQSFDAVFQSTVNPGGSSDASRVSGSALLFAAAVVVAFAL